MTRHDITPIVDEIDGWHGDDHYTGPRPIPSKSPLESLLAVGRRMRWGAAVVLLVALCFLLVAFVWGPRPTKIKHKPQADSVTMQVHRFLRQRGAPAERAGPVARAIVEASKQHEMDPALVAAIVTVENPTLRSRATSRAGAVGLMQVMPFWRRDRKARVACGGSDLTNDAVNLCFGIHVLKFTMRSRQTLSGALLYYNGCRSFRAPCGRYPRWVLARRSQVVAMRPDTMEAD
jgi:hypothetical protein